MKKSHIRIDGVLYEAVRDHDNDRYLPKRNDIVEDVDDARKDLAEAFREDLTPTAKKDRELKDLFGKASLALADLRDYLMKNYDTVEHFG